MATLLLTGVTGNVGSCLGPILKAKGHRLIFLVRPKNGIDVLKRLPKEVTISSEDVVLVGDIILPRLGLSESTIEGLKGKVDAVVNCAASISFSSGFTKETTAVNVGGVKNLLELADTLKIPEFHQVSTAYVAGNANFFGEDDFDKGQTPRNSYEDTKIQGERLVREWKYGKFSIYRLGIVVGNRVTGFTPAFNGYYGYMGGLWALKCLIASGAGLDLRKDDGIRFDRTTGIVHLPLCLKFSETSTLNFIPCDWACETMAELIGISPSNKVFHIVDENPQKARWLNNVSLKYLGIQGFYYGNIPNHGPPSLMRLQRLYERRSAQYSPYITHECKFLCDNVRMVLGGKFCPPPTIDEDFMVTLLSYAKDVNFGKPVG